MRGGAGAQVSRQELFEDYVNWYLHQCPDVRPCRDASLLRSAAQYLQGEPEPTGTFTVFPLYQALSVGSTTRSTDYRRLLSGLIRAADMLETICVNLFLQPWKKEIKTIKTFTGPFVYVLLSVLSRSTIRSVLASVGYEPNSDAPQREYRLREDASPDRATLVGFELLLARVECSQLLELLEKDQLGPQEWLEFLQRRRGLSKPEEPKEEKTTMGKEEEEKKREDADRKEAPPYVDIRLGTNPQPKPRRYQLTPADHSIIEMQMTYSDLTFRGRPLLPDKRQRGSVVRHAGTDIKAAAPAVSGSNDGGGGGRTGVPGDSISTSFSTGDGEPGAPQTVALRITLRSGSAAGPRPRPSRTAAEQQRKRPASPGPPSPSSTEEEEQELRDVAERLGRLHMQESKEELKGEEKSEERRNKVRKGSSRRELLETRRGAPGRSSRSEPAMKEEEEEEAQV
ncbi:spermatogenesis-associated protein 2-like protein [Brachionichthys hirsutus]|uniref:spermatogenesis-associated protein 2-like protein n=1 Tax=Brachionichthys hirsutus TaxID=412623 RepID=UPI003604DFBF